MRAWAWVIGSVSAVAVAAGLWAPDFSLRLDWLLLGSQFGLDGTNRPFLVVTGIAWLAAGILAAPWMGQSGCRRTVIALLFALLGNLTTVLAQDIITFYAGFAVLSFAAYGMIVTRNSPVQQFAGKVYIALAVLGELMLFAAMVGLVSATGGTQFPIEPGATAPVWLVLCIILGFGVKAGLVPLHVTLPLAYRAAPLASGVALAGAALNLGVLGWMRWLPVADAGQWSGWLLIVLGAAGYFYAILLGLVQVHPRALLGYSSISQISLMAVVIGAGILFPAQWPVLAAGVLVMMAHHAIAKTYLFIASGGAPDNSYVRVLWWTGITIAGLGLAGAPFTAGYAAKTVLTDAVVLVPELQVLGGLIWISSFLTACLLIRFAWLLHRDTEADAAPLVAPAALAGFAALATMTLAGAAGPQSLALALASVMPILAAALGAAAIIRLPDFRRSLSGTFAVQIPAGDIAIPITRILDQGARYLREELPSYSKRMAQAVPRLRIPVGSKLFEKLADLSGGDWSRAAATVLASVLAIAVTLVLFVQ